MIASKEGPIARKILAAVRKVQRQEIIDPATARTACDEMRRILDEAEPSADGGDLPPGFAAYIFVTNWALGLVEAMQVLPELGRFMDRIAKAEDDYMPDGPPMSPVTRSLFWAWSLWDLTIGVKRESLGSILLAIARDQGMDALFVGILRTLVASRLGLHVHEGVDGGRIRLRELGTAEVRDCICPAGYLGAPGELWLARVLLPPSARQPESIVVTTPYVIERPGVTAWQAFLDRTLPRMGRDADAYGAFMKHGLDERYWFEYVFEAYASDRPDAIFLAGLPDIAESRPHSRVNSG